MNEIVTRTLMIQRLCAAAEQDERIVGLLDYGSSSEGRADQWSDVDVALFIRDADLETFNRDWETWATQFGELLLAYIGPVGHPWTVYRGSPIPLRVDFGFHAASTSANILTWPNSPVSVEAMVLCDKTGGQLSDYVQQLVGRSLAPENKAATFERICGDFWYYLLYAYCKLQRSQQWFAREAFNVSVMGNLMALLKMEVGAYERWLASNASWKLEQVISTERLMQLEQCVPVAGSQGLHQALITSAKLGRDVCASIAAQHSWQWPNSLADETISVLHDVIC
jgi:lincosamide nucleotidyltransferase